MAMFPALQRQQPRPGSPGGIIGAVGGAGPSAPVPSKGGAAGMGAAAGAAPASRAMSAPAGGLFAGGNTIGGGAGTAQGRMPNFPAMAQRQPLNMGQRVPQMGALRNVLSDERSKETIRALRSRLADLGEGGGERDLDPNPFRSAENFEYEYKDPEARGAAPGRHVGPMAQDLEGIPGVVRERPDGMKEVDAGRLSMATAGEVGSQRREIDELRARLADLEGNPDAVLDVASGRR